ncbi:hypothetical protein [Dickeya sp. NCPPB 3274]|uniref:hypothetical protein n=1 Tax=Dickeya sp. NCPPB 3274 TaxID=568766 RepID=UPI0003A44C49|nr:hypothetical protein [Dickeya sp. NCPPB 3274]
MMINKAAFCALIAVVLSGCGGREPTEQDIRHAVDDMVAQTNQEIKKKVGTLFNDEMVLKINSLKKLNCIRSENKGYQCNVDLDMSLPLVGNKKEIVNFTFIQDDGSWKLIK